MSPTIMVLTDSPHVPTTDSLTGNTCKITKNSRNGGRTGLQPGCRFTGFAERLMIQTDQPAGRGSPPTLTEILPLRASSSMAGLACSSFQIALLGLVAKYRVWPSAFIIWKARIMGRPFRPTVARAMSLLDLRKSRACFITVD